MPRLLQSTFIAGPAGRLEALLEAPDDEVRVTRAAVICHPHPLYGGTMHNKVVFRLAKAARRTSAVVLRFNFRGVGQSAGSHDEGAGEQDDLRAALGYISDRYPGLPLLAAGFSFGARVALRVACGDSRVERVVGAGTPVNRGDWSFLEHCGCAKAFVHSTNDEHGARSVMEAVFASAAGPKSLAWVEAKDHFFADALDQFEDAAFEAFTSRLTHGR
jgi:alpha/beta superfamily hydrolase